MGEQVTMGVRKTCRGRDGPEWGAEERDRRIYQAQGSK